MCYCFKNNFFSEPLVRWSVRQGICLDLVKNLRREASFRDDFLDFISNRIGKKIIFFRESFRSYLAKLRMDLTWKSLDPMLLSSPAGTACWSLLRKCFLVLSNDDEFHFKNNSI